jgi:hypothetical protein
MNRVALYLAKCLVCGIVLTMMIAWALAIALEPLGTGNRLLPYVDDAGRAWVFESRRSVGGSYFSFANAGYSREPTTEPALLEMVPRWSRMHERGPEPPVKFGNAMDERAFGWPFDAMLYRERVDLAGSSPRSIRFGLPLPGWTVDAVPGSAVPLGILWGGFAANTALATGMWFCILFAPGIVRRAIRRHRGECPRCGYDLKGAHAAGCPECAWNRPSDSHTA